MIYVIFFLGLGLGVAIGYCLAAIMAAARRADDWEEWAAERRKEQEVREAEKRDLLGK